LGKKVINIELTKNNVKVFCEDSSTYEGDFLIGADGARSKTRNKIYEYSNLEKENLQNKFEAIFVTWFLGFNDNKNDNIELNKYKKEDIETMKKKYSNLPTTHGCNFGDVLDNAKVSVKVNLEECLFKKWYHDRIVLIGDAAHKLLP
ncbi:hypothetical protein K492DRAFT_102559, partial [Lichtheimia hyalospora FSU 10163]